MARRVLHPQWRDSHEPTPYPFADHCSLTSTSGAVIPELVFLDAILYPVGGETRAYLSQIDITHEQGTIWIGDSAAVQRASVTFDLLSPPDELRLADSYGRPAGLFVSQADRLAVFQGWDVGTHEFRTAATEFVADCCVPLPQIGLRGIALEDGSLFTEDVWMIGDDGIVLTPSLEDVRQPGCLPSDAEQQLVIRVDVVGDPLFRRRLCQALFSTPHFLERIRVRNHCRDFICYPDGKGNFNITAGTQDAEDSILRIRMTNEGLIVEAVGERLKSVK